MLVCDICGENLVQSGNDCIYSCVKPMLWTLNSELVLDKKHFVCHINSDNSPRYKKLNIYPYTFQLFYEDNKSIVSKFYNPKNGEDDKILEVSCILDLPWHDSDLLLEKLKLYSIFS